MSKILAVRLSSLGDVVLTQPVITALAQTGHEVSLLTKPVYRAVAEMFPGIAGVLTSPEDLTGEYALVLDWHGTLRARTWISRLKKIKSARYAKRSWARRLLVRPWGHPVFWNTWPTWGEDVSVTAAYARAAEQAGLTLPRHEPRLIIPASAQQAAEVLLARAGLNAQEGWVAMAPGAKWPTKQWSWEAYGALAAALEKSLNLRTVFLGASADIGVCQAARVRAGGRAVSLAGQTSLPALAALLSQARLLVSNDSGPLHLGIAVGARVLALFGPTVREFGFMPKNSPRVRVLARDLPCRPCSLHGSRRCPLGHHACLSKITVEEVVRISQELLTSPMGAAGI